MVDYPVLINEDNQVIRCGTYGHPSGFGSRITIDGITGNACMCGDPVCHLDSCFYQFLHTGAIPGFYARYVDGIITHSGTSSLTLTDPLVLNPTEPTVFLGYRLLPYFSGPDGGHTIGSLTLSGLGTIPIYSSGQDMFHPDNGIGECGSGCIFNGAALNCAGDPYNHLYFNFGVNVREVWYCDVLPCPDPPFNRCRAAGINFGSVGFNPGLACPIEGIVYGPLPSPPYNECPPDDSHPGINGILACISNYSNMTFSNSP